MKITVPDLTKDYPRSPRERLGGFVHLARMIDKARAKGGGMLGEYLYPCPLDESLLEFIGIDGEAFQEVAEERGDAEVVSWLQKNRRGHTPDEIEAWSLAFLNRRPQDEEGMKRFIKIRDRVAPNRKDVTAWVDLLDLDEGREVPPRPLS
ncbi:MAG: DUF5069 domain-containing protein [Nitrospiria bacterium]